MKSLFGGSAVIAATILSTSFLLSARSSVAETLLSSFQKPTQELNLGSAQVPKQDPMRPGVASNVISSVDGLSKAATAEDTGKGETTPTSAPPAAKSVSSTTALTAAPKSVGALTTDSGSSVSPATLGATYTATAYSLGGRTASGIRVSKGLIAADPRVLPLGTRVRLEAGAYSGEYLVADTGAAVHGKRIDIWTPNTREANRFGRRLVKLTVLSFPAKRASALRHRKR
ncbi:MAG TPA: 3D domain-containing protein [Pyrinomonadaceae bacterium]|nr:3D domain-containing protein [Pyrinomonadaceae bacterium]